MVSQSGLKGVVVAAMIGTTGLGGTCSEPPPWHDVSGTWVNASWGAEGKVTLGRSGHGDEVVDVDVAMSVTSALPTDRIPLAVRGAVCVIEGAGLGLAGTYTIDPARSTWAGSDYGGARMDIEARASDGRVVGISQAFMHNASPDALDNSIWAFTAADGASLGAVRFEDFTRSAEVHCP